MMRSPPTQQGSSPHMRGARREDGRRVVARRDHPRTCGEHVVPLRGRGRARGIIPAHAGSTCQLVPDELRHPGSSPHMRGAHLLTSGSLPGHRDFNSLSFSRKSRSQNKNPRLKHRPPRASSAILPGAMAFACAAPPRLWRTHQRGVFRSLWPADQLQPIHVDRLPIGLVNLKSQMLLVVHRVHHDGSPSVRQRNHSFPQLLSNAGRRMANEHARGYLQQPSRQIPAQTARAGSQHHNDHVSSTASRSQPSA